SPAAFFCAAIATQHEINVIYAGKSHAAATKTSFSRVTSGYLRFTGRTACAVTCPVAAIQRVRLSDTDGRSEKKMARGPIKKKTAAKKPAARKVSRAKVKPAAPARTIKVSAPAGKAITQSALMQVVADHTEMSRAEAKRFVETYIDVVRA